MRVALNVALAAAMLAVWPAAAQQKPIDVDLARLAAGQGWKVVNRGVTAIEEEGKRGVRLDERAGDGAAWLEGFDFSNGVIELDLRGKDAFQKSFIGVAFHGADEKTFEAVYFRPFNFRSTDEVRRIHAVEYISHPVHTWQKLRTEHPGVYEKPVEPAPDPNGWFHARVVVARPKVSVFVNGATRPCLEVESLTDRQSGSIGLFVGTGSGGDFANLKITPTR